MAEYLSYREIAALFRCSPRTVRWWRTRGYLQMTWERRGGQLVRVATKQEAQRCFRERRKANPAHQYRMRRLRENTGDTPTRS